MFVYKARKNLAEVLYEQFMSLLIYTFFLRAKIIKFKLFKLNKIEISKKIKKLYSKVRLMAS